MEILLEGQSRIGGGDVGGVLEVFLEAQKLYFRQKG